MTPRELDEVANALAEKVSVKLANRSKWLSEAEIADYLGVSKRQVVTHQVPYRSLGGRKLYDPAEVDAWLRKSKASQSQPSQEKIEADLAMEVLIVETLRRAPTHSNVEFAISVLGPVKTYDILNMKGCRYGITR